ncbi:MAG: SMI1/KNR4 family protein [Sphingorhabdus sp.]
MKIDDLAACITSVNCVFSEEDLVKFEKQLGYEFPQKFRSFVLLCRGGGEICLNDAETLEFKKSKERYYPRVFFQPGAGGYNHIRPLSAHFADLGIKVADTPCGIFTIADDLCGNVLTVDCRTDTFGQVAIIDHETVGDSFFESETYTVVCVSFEDFVKRCHISVERYVVTIGNDEPFDIMDYSRISEYLEQARTRQLSLRLVHNDEWIEFRPEGIGGLFFRRFYGTTSTWMAYYPEGVDEQARSKWLKLRNTSKIISFSHIILLFESFFSASSANVEIRMVQL